MLSGLREKWTQIQNRSSAEKPVTDRSASAITWTGAFSPHRWPSQLEVAVSADASCWWFVGLEQRPNSQRPLRNIFIPMCTGLYMLFCANVSKVYVGLLWLWFIQCEKGLLSGLNCFLCCVTFCGATCNTTIQTISIVNVPFSSK